MKHSLIACVFLVTVPLPALAQSAPADTPPPERLGPTSGSPDSQAEHAQTAGRQAPGSVKTVPSPYPANASGYGLRIGDYYVSRWAEDWSWLADAPENHRRDPLDGLKFIGIAGSSADGIYLTLSDEERFRYEHYSSPGLKSGDNRDLILMRSIIGADLHLGSHIRVFGEVNSSQEWGSNIGTPVSIQRNDAVVQQLFGEVRGGIGTVTVGAMVGRQEFQDGPISIITVRPDNNVYVAFNGVRLYADASFGRVSLFGFRSTDFRTGAFDDPTLNSERFKGISTSFKLPQRGAKLFLDPFLYHYRNDAKRWGSIVGQENRDIYGTRLWGTVDRLTLDLTVIRQSGDYIRRPISATGVFTNLEYSLSTAGIRPRIGFHTDYASGGGAYGAGTLRDFNFLFGSTPYISWGHFVITQNLFDIAPRVRISPTQRLTLTTEAEFLHRPSERDAVYSNTAAYSGTQNVRGRDIGTLYRADVRWTISRHFGLLALFEYLDAGHVLTQAKYSDTTYLGLATTFAF